MFHGNIILILLTQTLKRMAKQINGHDCEREGGERLFYGEGKRDEGRGREGKGRQIRGEV